MRSAVATLLLCAVAFAPGLARADEADDLYAQAEKAFAAKEYPRAEDLLRRAYAKKHTFDIGTALGQVLHEEGKNGEAAEILGATLHELPPTVDAAQKAQLSALFDTVRAETVLVAISATPEGTELHLDKRTLGRAPLQGEVYAEPGTHTVSGTKAGFKDASATFTGSAGGQTKVSLVLEQQAAPSEGLPAWPVWMGVGVGVSLFGAAIGVHVLASGKQSDADALRDEPGTVCPGARCAELAGLYDDAAKSFNARNGLLIAGAAVSALTVGYGIGVAVSGKAEAQVSLVPSFGGMSVAGTF